MGFSSRGHVACSRSPPDRITADPHSVLYRYAKAACLCLCSSDDSRVLGSLYAQETLSHW